MNRRSIPKGSMWTRQNLAANARSILAATLLLVIWEVVAHLRPRRYMPSLFEVGESLLDMLAPSAALQQIGPSLLNVAVGLMIGTFLGVAVGVPLGLVRNMDPWIRPAIEFLRAIPSPALLPAALVVLGTGNSMRILLISLACTFPVLWNSLDGARRVEPLFIETSRVYGVSGLRLLRSVILPATLPQIVAGVRIALGVAFIMMIISELIGATQGIGAWIFRSQSLFRVADTYAGIVAVGLAAWAASRILDSISRRAMPWYAPSKRNPNAI